MLNRLITAAAAVVLTTPLAVAGPIDSACVRSERGARNGALCGCIQQVADSTLSRSDQRRAARFFKDAEEAQAVRMSKTDADNAFWARYQNFASTAEAYCSR
ncbi:hypothetical protein RM190_13540 [Paracoccus sp. CPCC 101403]|uniref:Arginine transporter n=2 Tax=Paracoccus broussonetiae TaxID=3075834 RepID=A0ABU3EF72_9RHOB|nr:hypothetical protein [Paracoccus sp. CPCC 101403]MDT1062896.1 hypothetical protein [Paracoccus sp. CPCC 101403]